MTKPLVIVESPTKVKTVAKYLGSDYKVAATVGHIKDLPKNHLGVDFEHGFEPQYAEIDNKKKVIADLKKAAGTATEIYLASDPDREGEAIAWHAAEILEKKGRKFYRVLFHELTKNAIIKAMQEPQELDGNKYEAQKARRVLDRIVGYEASPLLWKKVQRGLSAGRVQSVAVRIIVERERAIWAFVKEEFWSITADLKAEKAKLSARLVRKNNKKLEIHNEEEATAIVKELETGEFIVAKTVRKTVKKNPLPPFTTSKLQQDAINRLHFSSKKTMQIAQQLYEGIDLGAEGAQGLITYMRTDSTRISMEAANEAKNLIAQNFGQDYTLEKPRFFTNSKKAQDAHEAIRPASVFNTPEKLKPFLNKDQFALYRLIWDRFVASQMAQAILNQMTITINNGPYSLTSGGSTIQFDGYLKLYKPAETEGDGEDGENTNVILPEINDGQKLDLQKLHPKQHFTQPPPRFSEASLVKELEENGIGRPSTYASILSTIKDKGYVTLDKRYFHPTELGIIVNDMLVQHFPQIFNVAFTAKMEENLDAIENKELGLQKLMESFYPDFEDTIKKATEDAVSIKGVGVPTGLKCPKCDSDLNIRIGKFGHYLSCVRYPDCDFSADYTRNEQGQVEYSAKAQKTAAEPTGRFCSKCESPLVVKNGRFGEFLACSAYPKCKYTETLRAVQDNDPNAQGLLPCPKPKCQGQVVEKKSRAGKVFYGCNCYPDCDFAVWDKPRDKRCPQCDNPYLLEKSTKKDGDFLSCPNKECGYKETLLP